VKPLTPDVIKLVIESLESLEETTLEAASLKEEYEPAKKKTKK
jgi:hypothetical protein